MLRHLAGAGMAGRGEIAAGTGLTPSAVASHLAELERRGFVVRTGSADFALDGSQLCCMGIEIGARGISVMAIDLHGGVVHRKKVRRDNRESPGAVLDHVVQLANGAREELGESRRVCGVATAVPGLVDATESVVVEAPELGWARVPAGSVLEDALGPFAQRVRVGNDANMGAVAELVDGAGAELGDFIYVTTAARTVGSGIVSGGSVFLGAGGSAGELGHIAVDPGGALCRCGARGCLEVLAAETAIEQRFAVPGGELAERAQDGNDAVLKVLGIVGAELGCALAAAMNVVGPQAVVLGGFYAPLARWLAPYIQDEISQRVVAARRRRFDVHASHWPFDAAVRGAASSVLLDLFSDPLALPGG